MENVLPEDYKYELGKCPVLVKGSDVTIIAISVMVTKALKAGEILKQKGISAEIINCSTIKPIDSETIVKSLDKTGAAVTAEDHNVIGGLAGAVSELLAKEKPSPVEFIGLQDRFGASGDEQELYEMFGMSAEHIAAAAERVLAVKKNKK